MIRRICTLAAVVLVALALAPAASAQEGYGGGHVGGDGTTISGVICDAVPGVSVNIFVDGVLAATVTTNAQGEFSATLNLSAGTHTVVAKSANEACVLGTEITVGSTGTGGTPLPRTGSNDTLPLTRIGIGAIAAGGILVLLSRKRTSSKVDLTV